MICIFLNLYTWCLHRNYFPFHCPLNLRVCTFSLPFGWGSLQVKEVAPEARRRNAKLSFALVYPDRHGRFVLREVSISLLSHVRHACTHIFMLSGGAFYLVKCVKMNTQVEWGKIIICSFIKYRRAKESLPQFGMNYCQWWSMRFETYQN